jgi:tetratricopeptide (TPR) repeat protein
LIAEQLTIIRDLINDRDLRKAESALARLLRGDLSPRDLAQTLVLRARARLLAARPEEALDDLQAAQTDDPALGAEIDELIADANFARFELASVGFADRAYAQRAEVLYRRLIAEHPDYNNLGWIHYQLGRICLTDRRTDEALTHVREALLAPSPLPGLTAYCYERLGFAYFYELRDSPRALSFLDKALFTYPATAERTWVARVQTLRSRVLRALGQDAAALSAVEAAIDIARESDESRLALADALLTATELLAQMGARDRELIARAQQFINAARRPPGIDVTWSRMYEMMGNAHFNLGQYAAASAAYEQALQYNPYHPWEIGLHYQIARSYYHAEAYERAIEAIETLLRAAAHDNQTLTDYRIFDVLGNAHFALKHYRAAADAYSMALRLAPPNAPDLDKIRRYHQFAHELRASSSA